MGFLQSPVSPERDPLPSSGHWGAGGLRPLAAGSCVGLFLTVPCFTHLEMRVTTASPHGLPQTPKDVMCVKRTCGVVAQYSRASRWRFSQRPIAHAAAAPRTGTAGSSCRGAGLWSVRCVTHVSSAGGHSPPCCPRARVSAHDRAWCAALAGEDKAPSPLRGWGWGWGRILASALGAFFNLYVNFQIYAAGFACLVLALSGLFLVASQLCVDSWLSDSFCDLNLENDIIYQENSFRFTVLPFPLHMRMVYSLSM